MKVRLSRQMTIGLGLVGVVLLFLETTSFWLSRPATKKELARWLATSLERSSGQETHISEASLQLFPFQIVAKGIRVGPAKAPVLTLEGAQLNLGSVRFSERQLLLNLLYLKGLHVYPRGFPPRETTGKRNLPLRIKLRQVVVEGATVNNYKLAPGVVLTLEDFELLVSGKSLREPQNVCLEIGKLTLKYGSGKPLVVAVRAWGLLSDAGFELQRLKVVSDALQGDVYGAIHWQPELQTSFQGRFRVHLPEVDQFFALGLQLGGIVNVQAEAKWQGKAFTVDARVHGGRVAVVGLVFDRLEGDAHISPDGVEVFLDEGLFAGGRIEGSYQLGDFGPTFAHKVALRGEGLDLERFLGFFGVPKAGLGARAQVNAELTFDGSAIGQGRGTAFVRVIKGEGELPVEGQLTVSLRDDALVFDGKKLHLGGGTLQWQGTLSLGTWLPRWHLQGEGLQIEAWSQLLAGWIGMPILPRELSGASVFALTLSGSFTSPTLTGEVALSPVCLGPLDADALEGKLTFSQGVLRFSSGQLLLGRGQAQFAGELDVRQGLPEINLSFASKSLPLERIAAWAGLRFPLSGSADLDGEVKGNLEDPRVKAHLRLQNVSVVGLLFGNGQGEIGLDHGVLEVSDAHVGGFSGSLSVDFFKRYVAVAARVRGLGLEPLSPLLSRLLGSEIEAEVAGEFPWDQPAGHLTLHSSHGTSGSLTLAAQGLSLSLNRPGAWQWSGEIVQKKRAFVGNATLTVTSLGTLVTDLVGQEQPLDGFLRAEMAISFGGGQVPTIEGQIKEASLTVEGQRVTLAGPANFALRGNEFALGEVNMVGPSARFKLRGYRSASGALGGDVSALIPASLLGALWPEAAPQGQVELLGQVSGTVDAPRIDGRLQLTKGSLRIPGLPAPVTSIQGEGELAGESLNFRRVHFAFLGGTGICSGQLRFYPQVEIDLELKLQAVRWPLVQGFEPSLDGELRLWGDLVNLQLSGELSLRRSLYQRDLSLQQLVLKNLLSGERVASPERGMVSFDVHISIPGTLEVRTPLARLVTQGKLHLVGDSNLPGLLGHLEISPGGEVELSGIRYEVDRARITFSDPTSIRPVLDIQAHGQVQNFTVNVGLVGTLDRLVPSLSSDPPLPEADILALLALGVPPESSGAGASASAMATSFLTEQLTGTVTQRTRTLLALDQLRIDPFVTSESGTPTARVTMVKQLSPDWSVTVSANLSSNREEVFVSRWRLGKDIFLEATRDIDGSYSLEVRWRRRY